MCAFVFTFDKFCLGVSCAELTSRYRRSRTEEMRQRSECSIKSLTEIQEAVHMWTQNFPQRLLENNHEREIL